MSFGQRLRKRRQALVLSQAAIAQKAGIPASAVSHFEADRRQPNCANLVRLCNALRCSSDYLLGIK